MLHTKTRLVYASALRKGRRKGKKGEGGEFRFDDCKYIFRNVLFGHKKHKNVVWVYQANFSCFFVFFVAIKIPEIAG